MYFYITGVIFLLKSCSQKKNSISKKQFQLFPHYGFTSFSFSLFYLVFMFFLIQRGRHPMMV